MPLFIRGKRYFLAKRLLKQGVDEHQRYCVFRRFVQIHAEKACVKALLLPVFAVYSTQF